MFMKKGLVGLLALGLCAGCGPRNNPTLKKTVPIQGRVVLTDGSPVRGGQITLHPKDPIQCGAAHGVIGKDGRFRLGTYTVDDGVIPGEYVVTIVPQVYDPRGNLRPDRSLKIPARYANPETSQLQVTIADQDGQELHWVLR